MTTEKYKHRCSWGTEHFHIWMVSVGQSACELWNFNGWKWLKDKEKRERKGSKASKKMNLLNQHSH